ncbi:hypothetical protein [uncultured Ilyobacter sp.]|uniref:hypothetical protein n=1 Tax=uncultured Ilyobacter sp. TaxID=544433 RepID=UPI0029F48D01|nr:hypothetical protein [uncultured Ilyobacter sp.]
MPIIYKQCPKCCSKNSVKIIYGMPTHKLFLEAEAGKAKLGGCDLNNNNPEYFCKDCRYEWNRQQAIDEVYRKIKIIKASVGGYPSEYYGVIINLTKLKATWDFTLGGKDKKSGKLLNPSSSENFIDHLKKANLLN